MNLLVAYFSRWLHQMSWLMRPWNPNSLRHRNEEVWIRKPRTRIVACTCGRIFYEKGGALEEARTLLNMMRKATRRKDGEQRASHDGSPE